MSYPRTSDYIESIKQSNNSLCKCNYLSPVLDESGEPISINGESSIVFKMIDNRNGKLYALKCFITEQNVRKDAYKKVSKELSNVTSCYMIPFSFYDNEISVVLKNGEETKYPVLIMNWIQGKTLDEYIKSHIQNQYDLYIVVFQFCLMASWLLSQPFAHGSLTPNNILIKDDGSVVLVDYDNLFTPSMAGEQGREDCSNEYCHPLRTIYQFDKHIDDFSLASIAMQLYAIAVQPNLIKLSKNDTLLLSKEDIINLNNSTIFLKLLELICYRDFEKLFCLFLAAHSGKKFDIVNTSPFQLNHLHLVGLIENDNEKYIDVFNVIKSAKDGDSERQKILGDMYFDCEEELKYKEAMRWFQKAAESGNDKAMGNIGYLYSKGAGVTKDLKESFIWYTKSSENGNAIAKYNLGRCYLKGRGTEKDETKAEELFCEAYQLLSKEANQGLNRSQYTLGLLYLRGYGVEKNISEAIKWFYAAAQKGNSNAQLMLANCYLNEESIRDYSKAFRWFCISAIQGNDKAQLRLAQMYFHGKYVDSNYEESAKWSALAAQNGNPQAQYVLGVLYYTGRGVIKDYYKAFELFCKAEDQGINPQFLLAKCYYNGQGVIRNYKEAINRFHILADQGHANSQYYLGNCYRDGLGVTKDNQLAIHWYKLASEQGHKDATKSLKECEEIERKKKEEMEIISKSTATTEQEIKRGVKDEYGVVYSRDWKRLLSAKQIRRSCTQYTIKSGTLVICDNAFETYENYYNQRLEAVYIPDSVRTIGNYAFSHCSKLHSIVIPNSVTRIGDHAFWQCSKTETISLPDSITYIGSAAFSGCKGIRSLSLPRALVEMGNNPFVNTFLNFIDNRSSRFIVENGVIFTQDKSEIISFFKTDRSYTVPKSVKHIRAGAFSGSYLYSIDLPSSLESIGKGAFSSSRLKTIEIPNSVVNVGESAFFMSKSLSSVRLPESVTTIEDYTFHRCDFLQSIEMPNSLTRIGDNAFEYCFKLQSIVIPNSVQSIGDRAFGSCSELKSIDMPESITIIGNCAFSSCRKLSSIILPQNIKSIKSGAFSWCEELKTIVVPESITEIEDSTFSFCRNLSNVILSPKTNKIGKRAFYSCCSLVSITLPKSIKTIDKTAFENCDNLQSIMVPKSSIKRLRKLLADYAGLLKEIE